MQITWPMDNSGVRECGRSSVWLRLPHLRIWHPKIRCGVARSGDPHHDVVLHLDQKALAQHAFPQQTKHREGLVVPELGQCIHSVDGANR